MVNVLGISVYHDGPAALVVDEEVLAATQEERFSQDKHDSGSPFKPLASDSQAPDRRHIHRLKGQSD